MKHQARENFHFLRLRRPRLAVNENFLIAAKTEANSRFYAFQFHTGPPLVRQN